MSPETPLTIIASSCNENTSQEGEGEESAAPQQLQLTSSFFSSVLEEKTKTRQECRECDDGSGSVSRDAAAGLDSSTLRYDTSSGMTPQCDQVLPSTSAWPTSTWGSLSQATSSLMQNYDLCSSGENSCYSHRPLLSDSMSKSEDRSTSTENSSTFLTGSFVSMYHDSEYVNLHQKPQEVVHWYRTERVNGEQDGWEVVEVGLDGAIDDAVDTRTQEVVDYPAVKTISDAEFQQLEISQRVEHLEMEVIGDEILVEMDLIVAYDGAMDTNDSSSNINSEEG